MLLIRNDAKHFAILINCLILVSKLNQYTWEKQINRFMCDNENVAISIENAVKNSDNLLDNNQISHFIYYLMSTTIIDKPMISSRYTLHPYFNILLNLNKIFKLDCQNSLYLSQSETLDLYWAYLLVLKKWLNNKEHKSIVTRFSDNHTRHLNQVKWLVNFCYKTYIRQKKLFDKDSIRSEICCFSKEYLVEPKLLIDSKLHEFNRDLNNSWGKFTYNLNKSLSGNVQIHYIRKLSINGSSLSILGMAFIDHNLSVDIDIKDIFEKADIKLDEVINIKDYFYEERYSSQNLENLTKDEILDRRKNLEQLITVQKKQLLDKLSDKLNIDSDLIKQWDYVENGDEGITKRHKKSFFSSSHKL